MSKKIPLPDDLAALDVWMKHLDRRGGLLSLTRPKKSIQVI